MITQVWMIAADTIGFVIPAAAAEKERRFKMNSSTIKYQIQLKSSFFGLSYLDTELDYCNRHSDEPQTGKPGDCGSILCTASDFSSPKRPEPFFNGR
jgi:hypothetical protein